MKNFLFFLETTSFRDCNFRTNSHDNITLIVVAIAARDKLREENLACDKEKVGHPCVRVTLACLVSTLVTLSFWQMKAVSDDPWGAAFGGSTTAVESTGDPFGGDAFGKSSFGDEFKSQMKPTNSEKPADSGLTASCAKRAQVHVASQSLNVHC